MPPRRDRQRAEIVGLISVGRLHRAADLAHEHLAEFPADRSLRWAIMFALADSCDHALRRRADEFSGTP